LAITFAVLLVLKGQSDSLKAAGALNTHCPVTPIEIADVYADHLKPEGQRQGFMHCFCLSWHLGEGEVSGALASFQSVDPQIAENPCEEWLEIYQASSSLTTNTGALIGAINALVCLIFHWLAPFEKCQSFTGEDKATVSRIIVVQFFNLSAVFLLAEFSVGGEGGLLLSGDHRDFDTLWFYDVGVKITMAMIANSIAPHIGRIFDPCIQRILMRWCCDRCCKKHLRKKTNIDEAGAKDGGKGSGGADKSGEEAEEQEGGERQDSVIDYIQEKSQHETRKSRKKSSK